MLPPPPRAFAVGAALLLLAAAFFLVKLAGPDGLLERDQERAAAYALDAYANGNWIIQTDWRGDVQSKPPFSTWLIAGTMLATGPTRLALYLPGAAAAAGLALLVLGAGWRRFGPWAATAAAVAMLASPVGDKMMAYTRSDAVFGLLVFGAALTAWRASETGRGWLVFWVLAAFATLTKGPLGLLLAAGGLTALFWTRGLVHRAPFDWKAHAPGIGAYLLLCGGWFAAAYAVMGQAVVDKMIGDELVGHAVGTRADTGVPLVRFYLPPAYMFSSYLPWSILTVLGLWRVFRRPAEDPRARAFERFVAAHLLFGLAVFALGSAHRRVHYWPMVPAAALLAGRELVVLLAPLARQRIGGALAAIAAGSVGLFAAFQWIESIRVPRMAESAMAQRVAREIAAELPPGARLRFYGVPYAYQFHLGLMEAELDKDEANRLIRREPGAWLLVGHPEAVNVDREEFPAVIDARSWDLPWTGEMVLMRHALPGEAGGSAP